MDNLLPLMVAIVVSEEEYVIVVLLDVVEGSATVVPVCTVLVTEGSSWFPLMTITVLVIVGAAK